MNGGDYGFIQENYACVGEHFYRLGLGGTSMGSVTYLRGGGPDIDARAECFGARCFGCCWRHRAVPQAQIAEVKMRLGKTVLAALVSVFTVLAWAAPAWAGPPPPMSMPAPGVLGLIALGVVGAIALSRRRK